MPTLSTKFLKCIPFILEAEGEYSNDPGDPGGETKWGITARAFPNALRLKLIGTDKPIKDLTKSECTVLWYYFWGLCSAENLPYPIALAVFNCAVNCGVQTSIKLLQRALGVKEDGLFGPRTLEALGSKSQKAVFIAFIRHHKQYYKVISERHANLRQFYDGWLNRLFNLIFEVLML
jgi:lysozyme family protein